ncbi:hypothetical protein ACQSFK_16050 [Salmonella enterica]|uniref:hypothetical protein n=1 Tax=Salmonella enterica TaxID=28901 RepID=UPI003D31F897
MNGKLIFCADSILRFRSDYDSTTALPLITLQNEIGKGDDAPYFFLRFFRHEVLVEKGTTLANILLAIEPWQELLTAYLDRDVAAYIDEIRKPSKSSTWELEWIGIDRRTGFYRSYDYPEQQQGEDLADYLNRKGRPTNEFEISSGCDISGFAKGKDERWSISGDIHEVKNLPVILLNKQVLSANKESGINLLNSNVDGVYEYDNGGFINGDTVFLLHEVLETIFIYGLFYYTPKDAQESNEILRARLSEFNEIAEGKRVSIEDSENKDEKIMKIEVAEGAFDDFIRHLEYEKELWKDLKENCKANNEYPVRIGNIIPAEAPEQRLFGKVIEAYSLKTDSEN